MKIGEEKSVSAHEEKKEEAAVTRDNMIRVERREFQAGEGDEGQATARAGGEDGGPSKVRKGCQWCGTIMICSKLVIRSQHN